jgi:hypothetical protein
MKYKILLMFYEQNLYGVISEVEIEISLFKILQLFNLNKCVL